MGILRAHTGAIGCIGLIGTAVYSTRATYPNQLQPFCPSAPEIQHFSTESDAVTRWGQSEVGVLRGLTSVHAVLEAGTPRPGGRIGTHPLRSCWCSGCEGGLASWGALTMVGRREGRGKGMSEWKERGVWDEREEASEGGSEGRE